MQSETETIIVGAGPAGLAVGAALKRANIPFVMLERGQRVGESWHGHYERLRLHTPKRYSSLPFRPFPREYPTYPSRQQVIDYLDDYARAFDMRPAFGGEVRHCAQASNGRWIVSTDAAEYRARDLVIATGLCRVPKIPHWPGQQTFPGTIIHSHEYTNGKQFHGQRVLVVGFGNSGAEIALDLFENGARSAIAVRGKVNVIPRDLLGLPIILFALLWNPAPPRLADAMNALTLRLAVGNLAALGLEKREEGPFAEIVEARKIPVIDVGTLARLVSGEIDVRKGLDSFSGHEVRFPDGAHEHFDAIVLATGFTSGLPRLFPDHADVLDAEGVPRVSGGPSDVPGLYFCGYDVSQARTGLLRQIGFEARRIVGDIMERRAIAP